MQNDGNIYSGANEICYAGANQICAASLTDFSQVVAFPSHFTLLLKFGGKKCSKSHISSLWSTFNILGLVELNSLKHSLLPCSRTLMTSYDSAVGRER